jgi:hypothetical protein
MSAESNFIVDPHDPNRGIDTLGRCGRVEYVPASMFVPGGRGSAAVARFGRLVFHPDVPDA